MERIISWKELTAAIEPYYPKPGGAGRWPVGPEHMLRTRFHQYGFDLPDPGAEKALCDSCAMRNLVGIELGREPVPDEAAICRFRYLMEKRNLGDELFRIVNVCLEGNGIKISRGTIVNATIISASSSTRNRSKKRDPEMRQTCKGSQWYFGMKAHAGVDSKAKMIHSVVATVANIHDSQVLEDLLYGEETRVWGDSTYAGQKSALRAHTPRARDFTKRVVPLRMRNGTPRSPFHPRLPRQPIVPRPSCVRAASPHHRKLGAGCAALPQMTGRCFGCACISPAQAPAIRPHLRLPGTTRLCFALHGVQRTRGTNGHHK